MTTFYLTREKATAFITDVCGVPIKASTLGDLAYRNLGPKYSSINGRIVYSPKDILSWLAEQAAIPPKEANQRGRHKRSKAAPKKNKTASRQRSKVAAA